MDGINLVHTAQISVGEAFGIHHPFFTLNTHTIINTWIVLGVLLLLGICVRIALAQKEDNALKNSALMVIESLHEMVSQSILKDSFHHTIFIAALFLFIFFCNCAALIPYVEEPTADINTTFAVAVISFFYIQIAKLKLHGLSEYIKDYFRPFFIMMPLEVIGKISSVVSLSFRLFGNIFGGSIIVRLYQGLIGGYIFREILGLITGVNVLLALFFILFEGALQAFVFSVLTLTYLSIALASESESA